MSKRKFTFGVKYVSSLTNRDDDMWFRIFTQKPHTRDKYKNIPASIRFTTYEDKVRVRQWTKIIAE